MSGGQANLKTRQPTAQDEEILRLKAMIGDLTMRNELPRERAPALERGRGVRSLQVGVVRTPSPPTRS
jgi:hypothetical protein